MSGPIRAAIDTATEGLAILAIFLLGLPILVLTWLMFEMKRPDKG